MDFELGIRKYFEWFIIFYNPTVRPSMLKSEDVQTKLKTDSVNCDNNIVDCLLQTGETLITCQDWLLIDKPRNSASRYDHLMIGVSLW